MDRYRDGRHTQFLKGFIRFGTVALMGRRLRTVPALVASRCFVPRRSTSSAGGSCSSGARGNGCATGSSRLLAGLEGCAGRVQVVGV